MAERMAMLRDLLGDGPGSSFEPIKHGTPTDDELEGLGDEIGRQWLRLGRRLGVRDQELQEINQAHDQLRKKGYYMLKHWKRKEGSAATYKAVCYALTEGRVGRPDLAVKFCHIKDSKLLNSLFDDEPHLQQISERLDTSLAGVGNYRVVAQYYGLSHSTISSGLETHDTGPTKALIAWLSAALPELTVQEFAAVVREEAERNDVAALLEAYDSNRINRVKDADSKLLTSLFYDKLHLQEISERLDTNWAGVGNYRAVAQQYGLSHFKISSVLEKYDRGPTTALIEWLSATLPELTVQEFAAVVRAKAERNDVAVLLEAYGSNKLNRVKDAGQFTLGNWIQGELLGKGAYGKVYKCVHKLHGTSAVKIVEMEPQSSEMHKEVKSLQNEISILKNVKHERIVTYYGSEEKDDHLYLFMDFMPGGSLFDHLEKNGVFSESVSKRYTKQMLEGVYFLHSKDIIHRDIKGSNVLLDGIGNVKLADFGLSKVIEKIGSKTDVRTSCGTYYWMSPEVCRGEVYGRKADIWSLGCTVVEMLTGKPPLGHLEPVAAMFSIGSRPIEPTLPEIVSQDAKEFIMAALTWNPKERPWSGELQRYTFVLNSTEDQ